MKGEKLTGERKEECCQADRGKQEEEKQVEREEGTLVPPRGKRKMLLLRRETPELVNISSTTRREGSTLFTKTTRRSVVLWWVHIWHADVFRWELSPSCPGLSLQLLHAAPGWAAIRRTDRRKHTPFPAAWLWWRCVRWGRTRWCAAPAGPAAGSWRATRRGRARWCPSSQTTCCSGSCHGNRDRRDGWKNRSMNKWLWKEIQYVVGMWTRNHLYTLIHTHTRTTEYEFDHETHVYTGCIFTLLFAELACWVPRHTNTAPSLFFHIAMDTAWWRNRSGLNSETFLKRSW